MRVINSASDAEEAVKSITVVRGKKTTTEPEAQEAVVSDAETTNETSDEAFAGYTPNYPGHTSEKDAAISAAMAQLQQQLNTPLSEGLTKWRKGYGKDENGNQKMLEYLEWHTVTRQLNRIFGPSNWMWQVKDIKTFGEDSESGVPCVVTATAELTITWPNNEVTSYINNGAEVVKQKEIWENRRPTGRYEPRTWEAFEMAFKGAAHDAFKRAATALGEQFGLALYVKEEEAKQAKTSTTASAGAESAAQTTSGSSATTSQSAAPQRRSTAPRQNYQQNFQPSVSPEDYDPDTDTVEQCQQCNGDIRGYYSARLKRVYTTNDLVEISKRKTGGQVLCYDCQQGQR